MKSARKKPMSKKTVIIRNKKRALQKIIGKDERWAPEYARLNMWPIMANDVSEDFMNEKRRRGPIGSRKPPASIIGSGRTRAVASTDQDQAWLPKPHQAPERNYAHGNVDYDAVPSPPQNQFEPPPAPLEPQPSVPPGIDLSSVQPGQYCLVYDNEVWPSNSIDEIEEAVEQMMRSDPNIQDNELIVMKRLNIKVGVSIE